MKKNLLFAGLIAFAGAGCATAATDSGLSEKAAERLSKYEQTGETRSCLSLTQIDTIDPLDDSHFLVTTRGGGEYLNTISGRCSGASRAGNYIQYTTSINQLCRGEIVRVVDNMTGMTTGSCGLGDFEKLVEIPEEEMSEEGEEN